MTKTFYVVYTRMVSEYGKSARYYTEVQPVMVVGGKMSAAIEKVEGRLRHCDEIHLATPRQDLALLFAQTQRGWVGRMENPR